jgi:hypothetical protein
MWYWRGYGGEHTAENYNIHHWISYFPVKNLARLLRWILCLVLDTNYKYSYTVISQVIVVSSRSDKKPLQTNGCPTDKPTLCKASHCCTASAGCKRPLSVSVKHGQKDFFIFISFFCGPGTFLFECQCLISYTLIGADCRFICIPTARSVQ